MVAIEIPSDYGYVVLVTVAFWIQQVSVHSPCVYLHESLSAMQHNVNFYQSLFI